MNNGKTDNKTRKIQSEFNRYYGSIIFTSIIILGGAVAFYLYHLDYHSLYFYSDSTTHALQSRQYVDSDRPGLFEHLGTVWLPIPHLLILPFSLIDPLFRSGFAGLAISLPFHAATSLILYKIVRRHVSNPYIPLVGAALYAFNPNFMYLALTPMTEAPFMLFFVASAYYFQRWLFDSSVFISSMEVKFHDSPSTLKTKSILVNNPLRWLNLIKSAALISFATLSRYEGWSIAISMVFVLVIIFAIGHKKVGYRVVKRNAILTIIGFSIISLSGIVFWITWNWYIYGDPLEFSANPIYSAKAHAARNDNRDILFLQPINVLLVYGTVLLYVFGPAILIIALLGFLSSTIFRKDSDVHKRIILYLFLLIAPIFTIISLLIGVGEMNLGDWYNSRFLILSAPLIIVLTCMFLSHVSEKIRIRKQSTIIIGLVIISLFAYQTISPFFTVVTYTDAFEDYSRDYVVPSLETARFLSSIYDYDGKIFIVATGGQQGVIAIESGLPLKNFQVIRDSDAGSTKFRAPWLYSNYFVISKEPQGDINNAVKFWKNNDLRLEQFYNKVYDNDYYTIFSKKHLGAPNCVEYDSRTTTLSIRCKSINLIDLYSSLNRTDLLSKLPLKSWLLNANLVIENGSNFYINSTDTSWLKINSTGVPHSIKVHGNLNINSVRITGWNTTSNDFARTDKNGTISRSYILVNHGTGTTNITDSEIAYLGYNADSSFGLTYYTGAGSVLKNNKIHDLFYGFYSSDASAHNIIIENNTIYNNTLYGLDPHSASHDLLIKNNHVFGNGKHGIICSTDCYNILIESNNVYENRYEGIMLYRNVSNSTVKNNILSYNREQIALYDSTNNNKVYNNTIIGGKVGIRIISNSSHNLINNNSIADTDYGIYLLKGASYNEINSNRIINTSGFAVLVQNAGTDNNIFKNNTLANNTRNEITESNLGASRISIVDNTISQTNR